MTHPIYDLEVERLDQTVQSLSLYQGHVLLIVNTASKCGFTPQYKDLETIYQSHKDRGLEILGFPCNQFAKQEPGDAADIGAFCQKNYGVTFPMFAKVNVNGSETHPLYQHLKHAARGVLGTQAIKWNFTKFLVDRQGHVVNRYSPNTKPKHLLPDIEKLLQ